MHVHTIMYKIEGNQKECNTRTYSHSVFIMGWMMHAGK